ncbi:MAG: helix-turn-helix domain-containing protein, partial [Deltaproteobacteria bacterium]
LTMNTSVRRRGPGSRADERHPTRHQLLEAADTISGRAGLAALSVAEITSEAGLGKGTFYIHFPDRAALLVELHRRFHDRLFERVVADTATMCPGPERARRRVTSFLDHSRRERAVRAMVLHARTEPDVLGEVRLRNDQASRLLAEDLRALVPHTLETARLLVAATAEVALLEFAAGRSLPRMRHALAALVPDAPVD